MKGLADFHYNSEQQRETKPVFQKLVLVVIDALRSDFLFDETNSHFHFIHSQLNEGTAWGFTAYSNPPTVTLPRLKGITTGSTPNFLDAILNVAEDDVSTTLADQDSLLAQFHLQNKKINFFGDDTWLKLFPRDWFNEVEGTNSFFVSDFEVVDTNVSRHLTKQLKHNHDWDVLIMHYLGLDHIGHKDGASSKFMPEKHIEMDNIVRQVYENIDDDTLLVVMGDHGMNEVGNHGGSSAGETSAGLVFLSNKLKKGELPLKQRHLNLPIKRQTDENFQFLTSVQQIDLVPTLATLFNIPIPKNNVGIVIPEFLQFLRKDMINIKLMENYHQLLQLSKGQDLPNIPFDHMDSKNIMNKMKEIQDELTKNATNYNYSYLGRGYLLLIFTTVTVFIVFILNQKSLYCATTIITIVISLLVGLSSFGSSFVEEEHQIWWWIITGSIMFSCIETLISNPSKSTVFNHFLIAVCARIIRGWNNSGQKHVYEFILTNILKNHYNTLWYLICTTIYYIGLKNTIRTDFLSFLGPFFMTTLCFVYKLDWAIVNNESVPEWFYVITKEASDILLKVGHSPKDAFKEALLPLATLFYQTFVALVSIRIIFLVFFSRRKTFFDDISNYISLLLIFQSTATNIPQFLVFEFLKKSITKVLQNYHQENKNNYLPLISLILQSFTFFQFGGTNSIATIDISNAYHGISENYNIYLVGIFMTISNFAPSIYWIISMWPILYAEIPESSSKWNIYFKNKLPLLVFNCIVGCCLLAACYILRYHLFIWSVFSPKLCYFLGWNVFMNFVVGWLVEGTLVALY